MRATITVLSFSARSASTFAYSLSIWQEPHRGGQALNHEQRKEGTRDDIKKVNFNDHVGSVFWPDNLQCIFWKDWECKGHHTGAQDVSMQDSGAWKGLINSYTYCPIRLWCPRFSPLVN